MKFLNSPVVASSTAEQGVLGSIPGSGKVLLGFSIRNFSVPSSHRAWIFVRLMAIGSLPLTWDLKDNWCNVGVQLHICLTLSG